MKGVIILCNNNFYHWEIASDTSFRKLNLHINKNIEKEINRFINWNGDYKKCSKCKESLPACAYFFCSGSGGRDGLHRYCKTCEKAKNYGWGRNHNNELNKNNLHYCSKCDRILPLNILYFNKTNGKCNKTGYASNCKECLGREEGFGLSHINREDDICDIKEGYKICSSCFVELPNNDEYFFKKNGRKNGMVICKKCKGHEYGVYHGNVVYKDIIPDTHKYCNVCKRTVKFEDFNFDTVCCKDCAKAKRKIYHSKPKTKHRLRMFVQKRRAKQKNLRHDLTKEQYEETLKYFDYCCAYCGISEQDAVDTYEGVLHQDHVIPLSDNGEYTKNNIIPACRSCNLSKNAKSLDEFFEYSKSFTKDKYINIKNFIEIYKDF